MRNLRFNHRLLLITTGRLAAVAVTASALLVALSGCAGLPRPVASTHVEPAATVVTVHEAGTLLLPDIDTDVIIEIARWKHDAAAAVSITFDDGTLDQYLLAAPVLDEHGMRATFFLIPGFMDGGIWNDSGTERLLFGWDAARNLHRRGHEIGAHTMTHGDLSRANRQQVFWELSESRQQLEARIPGAHVTTFAWPYWRSGSEARAVASEVFTASRAGAASANRFREHGIPEARPANRSAVNALALLPSHDPVTWREVAEELIDLRGWGVLSLHGVTDGVLANEAIGWQPLSLHQLRAVLAYLRDERYWVAPFGTVMDYIERRDATTLTMLPPSPLTGESAGSPTARFAVSQSSDSQAASGAAPGGFVTVVISNTVAACTARVLADERPIPVSCRSGRARFDVPDGTGVIDVILP